LDPFIYLSVAVPIGLALLALNFEIIKDSQYRRKKIRQKEQEAFLELLDTVRARSVDPDVNDYIKKVKEKLKERQCQN
jgi:hypothetical protein